MDISDTASTITSSNISSNVNNNGYVLTAVKTIHTWACVTQKTQLEESVREVLLQQVVPLLLGKRPIRSPPVGSGGYNSSSSGASGIGGGKGPSSGKGSGGQFSIDVPGSLAATLQDLQRKALGVATVVDGLHARKIQEINRASAAVSTNEGEVVHILQELEFAASELSRHRIELKCISQILSVVMVVIETPGLSLYPLLEGYKACLEYRKEQHVNAKDTLNISVITPTPTSALPSPPSGAVTSTTSTYSVAPIAPVLSEEYEDLYMHLISHLEPELQSVGDLGSVHVDANPAMRIVSLFLLPLANLRAANLKAMNMMNGNGSSSAPSNVGVDAADIGHSVVHHMLLDMHLLCTCPGFATGLSGRYNPLCVRVCTGTVACI